MQLRTEFCSFAVFLDFADKSVYRIQQGGAQHGTPCRNDDRFFASAYAIIVVHSPLHKSIDSLKGSHGHTYNHATGCIEFGGDLPSGTFLDLLCALQISQICDYHSNISLKYSLMPSIELVQESSIKLSLVTLLSMVPELNEYYTKVDTQNHLVHKLSIDTEIVNSSITYNFYIGNGIDRPSKGKA